MVQRRFHVGPTSETSVQRGTDAAQTSGIVLQWQAEPWLVWRWREKSCNRKREGILQKPLSFIEYLLPSLRFVPWKMIEWPPLCRLRLHHKYAKNHCLCFSLFGTESAFFKSGQWPSDINNVTSVLACDLSCIWNRDIVDDVGDKKMLFWINFVYWVHTPQRSTQ